MSNIFVSIYSSWLIFLGFTREFLHLFV